MAPPKAKSCGRIHPCPQEFDQLFPAKKLLPSLSHNPSAQWLMASIDVLLSSYLELLKILQNPQQCLLLDNRERVDRCLENLINHVDSCNELRESVWDIKSYQTLLRQTVHCMDRREFMMSKDIGAMSKLAECIGALKAKGYIGQIQRCSISLEVLEKLGSLRICADTLFEDMETLNECTTFVLEAIVKALSMKKKQGPVGSYCSLAFRFCKKLRDRTRSSSHLYELYMADVSVRGLYDLLAEDKTKIDGDEMHERVEILKKCEAELEKAICPLGRKIEELHKALINTRVASLDYLSYLF